MKIDKRFTKGRIYCFATIIVLLHASLASGVCIALKASNGQYLCAKGGGGQQIVANRPSAGAWETFRLIDLDDGRVALQAYNGQYLCAKNGGGDQIVANRDSVGAWETFEKVDMACPPCPSRVLNYEPSPRCEMTGTAINGTCHGPLSYLTCYYEWTCDDGTVECVTVTLDSENCAILDGGSNCSN